MVELSGAFFEESASWVLRQLFPRATKTARSRALARQLDSEHWKRTGPRGLSQYVRVDVQCRGNALGGEALSRATGAMQDALLETAQSKLL